MNCSTKNHLTFTARRTTLRQASPQGSIKHKHHRRDHHDVPRWSSCPLGLRRSGPACRRLPLLRRRRPLQPIRPGICGHPRQGSQHYCQVTRRSIQISKFKVQTAEAQHTGNIRRKRARCAVVYTSRLVESARQYHYRVTRLRLRVAHPIALVYSSSGTLSLFEYLGIPV